MLNLNATKQITPEVKVAAHINEIQVWIGERIEYVWFCNNIEQARYNWKGAVAAAKRIVAKMA